MIFGAILAGGLGLRMNMSDIPKQFLQLKDKPIIVHTLEKFLLCSRLDYIFIGVNSKWISYMQDLIKKYKLSEERIKIVSGGSDRNSTIMNIIYEIENSYGENDKNIIVTHDAVRPFVSLRIIEENIDGALRYGAVNTVISATDTIVVSENGKLVSDIPDRKMMYQGQTPQSFSVKILKNLYANLTAQEKEVLTDACKICVIQNIPVYLVYGEISNFKITTVEDYKIAKKCLED